MKNPKRLGNSGIIKYLKTESVISNTSLKVPIIYHWVLFGATDIMQFVALYPLITQYLIIIFSQVK